MGAWIETSEPNPKSRIPSRRTRMGAWIETMLSLMSFSRFAVAPVWVRGLKRLLYLRLSQEVMSHPYGCVD